jgi:hypothetical protein
MQSNRVTFAVWVEFTFTYLSALKLALIAISISARKSNIGAQW